MYAASDRGEAMADHADAAAPANVIRLSEHRAQRTGRSRAVRQEGQRKRPHRGRGTEPARAVMLGAARGEARNAGAGHFPKGLDGLINKTPLLDGTFGSSRLQAENVLVDRRGTARVLDFGLARLQGDAANVVAAKPQAALAALQPALRTPVSQPGALSGTRLTCRRSSISADRRTVAATSSASVLRCLKHCLDSCRLVGTAWPIWPPRRTHGSAAQHSPATTVPIEIQRALSADCRPIRRSASRAWRISCTLAIDSERDPAGAKRGRVFVSALIVGATLILALASSPAGYQSHFSMRSFAGVMGGVSLMFALAMIVYRRTLLTNAFHRGLVTMSFCGVLSILGARLMAWAAGVPIESYLPIDLMHFCCLGSAIAVCYLPRFWLLMPALFASALAALHWPAHC